MAISQNNFKDDSIVLLFDENRESLAVPLQVGN